MDLLSPIEWACKELYTTADQNVRVEAEKTCASLITRPDCISTCKSLLERADSCYSQYIAASTLAKFISNHDTVVHMNLRLQIRNFALNYLASQPNLEAFVQQALVTLICRLTKIGWFDSVENGPEFPFRDIFDSVKDFVQSGQIKAISVGVKLLENLVSEVSQSSELVRRYKRDPFIDETDVIRANLFDRKLQVSFRDILLFPIFELGLDLLRQTDANLKSLSPNDTDQLQVVQQTLAMVLAVLKYNFVGMVSGGECSGCGVNDELISVQLPASWRPVFLETNNLELFFRLFAGLPDSPPLPSLRVLPLACLSQITSIRRTLFTNEQRSIFLTPLMIGCLEVLRRRESLLCDPDVYYEFCRLLSRLKAAFQMGELLQIPEYPEFIKLVTDLTTHSLYNFTDESDRVSANSVHYLLALWQRLVASIPYARTTQPFLVDRYAPEVTRAYIESRLAGVPRYGDSASKARTLRALKKAFSSMEKANAAVLSGGQGDIANEADSGGTCPLDDTNTLMQQLDQFSIIGRCDYNHTCELVVKLFDQSFNVLQASLEQLFSVDPATIVSSTFAASGEQVHAIRLEENRLTWLVYMIGALINDRSGASGANGVDMDQLDGQLIARVLRLLDFGQACLNHILRLLPGSQEGHSTSSVDVSSLLVHVSSGAIVRLELSIITFLGRFRRIYVGENISRASKMYRTLADLVGVSDEQTILRVFVTKVLLNLRYWSDHEVVLEPSLKLFDELASSFSAMRRLLQLEDIKFMLTNHTPSNFRFLAVTTTGDAQVGLGLSRYRTQFYAILSRLMTVMLSAIGGDDARPFLNFLAPLTQVANQLISTLLLTENCSAYSEEARVNVIALARDLAGVSASLSTMAAFQHFLDWFYPSLFSLFGRALDRWAFDPEVTCPVIKLLSEMVNSRNDRLKFESTVPMGYLLLAEMTEILNAYGARLAPFFAHVREENVYSHKVKPLYRFLNALRLTISGKYANLAIFGLVGDDSFEKMVKLSTDMLLSVSAEELKSFTKLSKAYFALLECLTQNHMPLISSLNVADIHRFYDAIVIGVDSVDTSVSWSACSCLDYVLTYIYRITHAPETVSPNGNSHTSNGHLNGSSNPIMLLGNNGKFPFFVPATAAAANPATSAATTTSKIAQAARRLLASTGPGLTRGGAKGYCSALAIWADREAMGTANLHLNFLRGGATGGNGGAEAVPKFAVTSRHLMVNFLASFMNDECKNQWSISRPLLVLILLNQDYYANIQQIVLNAVSPHQRAELKAIFDKLMDGVEDNLFAKNRDRFTQNISSFRHSLMEFMKTVSVKLLGDQQATAASYEAGETFSLRSVLLSSAATI